MPPLTATKFGSGRRKHQRFRGPPTPEQGTTAVGPLNPTAD